MSIVLPLLTALLAAQSPQVEPVAGAVRTGTCILAGGGKLPKEVIARFVELAGGRDARIVLIPTASQSADDPAEHEELKKLWREQRGAEVQVLHTRDRELADSEAFCAPLREATGVWFGGGAQKRLADAYLGTRVEKECMLLLARGGVVGGTSAGTAIQTRTMIQEGKDPPIVAQGFDFVPGAISDQHFLKRERLPRLLKVLAAHPGHFGIGVDESTAVEIRGDRLSVIGASKAVLVLGGHDGHREVVTQCADGESIDLAAWRKVAAERAVWKLSEPFTPRLEAGSLVIGNGDAARERFVALAGGAKKRIAHIAARRETLIEERHQLGKFGADTYIVDLRDPKAPPFLAKMLAEATGVILSDSELHESRETVTGPFADALRTGLRSVLMRGGVVWANSALGEVVAGPWPEPDAQQPYSGYWRGFALLPGTTVLRRGTPPPGAGPITDGGQDAWLRRCVDAMPGITGLHVEGVAVVQGSTLEVVEGPTHVWSARSAGATGEPREEVLLEPGTRFDLVTGKKL